MTDNDTSFLLKELNTLSYDGSIHLIYELLQKIHVYDRIAKILHEQNAQLRIRNAALEVSLLQVAKLFAIQTMAGQHQHRTLHEQYRKQEQQHHEAEEITASKALTIDEKEQSSIQYHNSFLSSLTSLTVTHEEKNRRPKEDYSQPYHHCHRENVSNKILSPTSLSRSSSSSLSSSSSRYRYHENMHAIPRVYY